VVAAAVRQSGGPRALAELIEVERARPRGFRDVTSPTEAYDLLLECEVVGQVIHDETRLHGMPQSPKGWVLVQRDADYSLAAEEPGTELAKARAIVAERLAETAENPSAVGQIRRPRARSGWRSRPWSSPFSRELGGDRVDIVDGLLCSPCCLSHVTTVSKSESAHRSPVPAAHSRRPWPP
jgi:hypothetical protein